MCRIFVLDFQPHCHVVAGPDAPVPVRTYFLDYIDTFPDRASEQPLNGVSLLGRMRTEGQGDGRTESLPPLEFRYTQFSPADREFIAVEGTTVTMTKWRA